jgi:type VI secretion system protein ImpG
LPLLPWPKFAPAGYRHLQEYFALPQKFLFFDVRSLDAVVSREPRFEIALHFERPPPLPGKVGKENIRVNCVPVANLFKASSDPVALRALGEEHLVRAAGLVPAHAEIYSVEDAVGIPEGPGERTRVSPFFEFGDGTRGLEGWYYRLHRRLSPIDDGIDTYVSLTRPVDAGAGKLPATLSLDLVCTNRSLPGRLQLGDVSQPTEASPTLARFRNIVPVTKPVRPPLASDLLWRLLSHVAATRSSLADVQVLRTMLDIYNVQALVDEQSGRANRLRIDGIGSASLSSIRRLLGGAPVRGTRMSLEFDEAHFAGPGDAFLFGCVIDELLAARAGLNTFSELAVRLQPSRREYGWPARSGREIFI